MAYLHLLLFPVCFHHHRCLHCNSSYLEYNIQNNKKYLMYFLDKNVIYHWLLKILLVLYIICMKATINIKYLEIKNSLQKSANSLLRIFWFKGTRYGGIRAIFLFWLLYLHHFYRKIIMSANEYRTSECVIILERLCNVFCLECFIKKLIKTSLLLSSKYIDREANHSRTKYI